MARLPHLNSVVGIGCWNDASDSRARDPRTILAFYVNSLIVSTESSIERLVLREISNLCTPHNCFWLGVHVGYLAVIRSRDLLLGGTYQSVRE